MWTADKIKINIIRHGKTPLNERHCYIGTTDESLSDSGKREIVEKINSLIYPSAQAVFVSPLKRAKETASLIYPDITYTEIEEFRETDFGSFEGKNYEELKSSISYRKWIDKSRGISEEEILKIYGNTEYEERDVILPESTDIVISRVKTGFLKVILKAASYGFSEISIIAHGGTIMAITKAFSQGEYYESMVACSDGIEAEVTYTVDGENITISCFSINNRIHS